MFAHYEFNLISLIPIVLSGALVAPFSIAHFLLPDTDFWAQKSVTQNQMTYGATTTQFYSIMTDENRDGETDVQMAFEKSKTVVYNKIESVETTLLAGKPQNPFSFLGEYIEDSWNALWGNARGEDRVFNDKLTEEMLDSSNFGGLYPSDIATVLAATYRKFTKITSKTFIDELIEEKITVSEWEDGELIETRIYTDEFDSEFFDSSDVITITNLNTGQISELPIDYSPSYLNSSRDGWARDLVSEKFDQVFVIGEDFESESINIHQETITITIPSRFSPYHDHKVKSASDAIGDSSFEVTGVLFTPEGGEVYYTSDKKAFKSGEASTEGLYFYYDGDLDNFYETVYVLSPDDVGDGVYDVLAMGYNYDGEHKFSPYEKVRVEEPIIFRDDFAKSISSEVSKFGVNWVYNFAELKGIDTLFPKSTYDGYEVKDSLFEIWKLVETSEQNTKFSRLFYEVRHKEYDSTWAEYSKNFWRDVGDQVFATLVASAISFAIMASSLGIATPLAHVAYFITYSVISKFQMDLKAKEAEAQMRASTFYPEGADRSEPQSLNQKCGTDEFWGDSMPAALSGHPGAFYATISGGEVGSQYTAQVVVSPPSDARFTQEGNAAGIWNYLGHNVGTFGSGNPDLFTALDFDNHNLDFHLVSSELYAYNDEDYFSYVEDISLVDMLFELGPTYVELVNSYQYPFEEEERYITGPEKVLKTISTLDSYVFRQNTLGYLTKKINEASGGTLSAIKPICVDGQPQYIFTTQNDVLPTTALFQPLIVSPERYEELEARGKTEGYIVIDVSVPGVMGSKGIDSNNLTYYERELYLAKIPFAEIFGGFNYPIKSVELYAMVDSQIYDFYLYSGSEYNMSLGNLYFDEAFMDKIPLGIGLGDTPLNLEIWENQHYKLVVKIAKILPYDGSEELSRSALNIATAYSIMDYFDQYTYAQTSAQMIAEIGYTEIMTITSTAISAPAVVLGGYAVESIKEGANVATSILVKEVIKKVIIGTIKETVEEIVIDGFFETAIQSAVRMAGGNDDAGHWLSTLFTSLRETANFGILTGSTDSQSQQFQNSQATTAIQNQEMTPEQQLAANEETLAALIVELKDSQAALENHKLSYGRLLATGVLAGLTLFVPSLAGFNIYSFSKLIGSIKNQLSAKSQNKFLVKRNSMMVLNKKMEIIKQKIEIGKKPISALPENNFIPVIECKISNTPNAPNPKLENRRVETAIVGSAFMTRLDIRDDYGNLLIHPKAIKNQLNLDIARAEKMRVETNQENLEKLSGKEVSEVLTEVKDELSSIELKQMEELIESLKGKNYGKYPVLIEQRLGGGVYYKIIDIIHDKSKKGIELTEFENDILDVATFIMGGYSIRNGKSQQGQSAFADYFRRLVSRIEQDLSFIMKKKPDFDINKILFEPDTQDQTLSRKQYDLDTGLIDNHQEIRMEVWCVRLENAINSLKILTKQEKYSTISSIRSAFNDYYYTSEMLANNPLYRPARYMLAQLGEVLLKAKDITKMARNDYAEIGKLAKKSNICYKLMDNIKTDENYIPENTLSFKEDIIAGITGITEELKKAIDNVFSNYLEEIGIITESKDYLAKFPDGPKKVLLEDIFTLSKFLPSVKHETQKSLLLFGDKESLRKFFRYDRAHLYRIWNILYTISNWEISSINSLGNEISYTELEDIKSNIIERINSWVLENHFDYLDEAPTRRVRGKGIKIFDKTYLTPEYNLMQALWLACVAQTSNPKYSFSKMDEIFKYSGMRNKLSISTSGFGAKELRGIMLEINKWAGQEAETSQTNFLGIPTSEKLNIYQNAMDQIDSYMKERGLHFIKPEKTSSYDRDLWYEKITRSYHTVMLFARQLGFDPLTFRPLNDKIFKARAYKKSSGKLSWTSDYRRHYLSRHNKKSILLQDLALTDLWTHNYWEQISEADARVILTQFSMLVNQKGTVTRQNIEAAFKGYEWVLNDKRTGWFTRVDFNDNLNEFNKRKDKYQSLGLDGFMQDFNSQNMYQNLYNRFYQTVVDDKGRSLILFTRPMRPFGVADYSDIVGWEFYFSNNP